LGELVGGRRPKDVETMLRHHLAGRDITNRRVLAAMAAVPREHFVPDHLRAHAYDDGPLPIGHDQTISQPYIVALMTQEARIGRAATVLDVGTGSGYQAAVAARIAKWVVSVERLASLSEDAAVRLARLGVHNVSFVVGDGAAGWPTTAPYDAIIVAAAAPKIPEQLLQQLAMHGRLIIPVGDRALQDLTVVERTPRGLRTTRAGACRFVPLVSNDAFTSDW
jgi:protein-L-isoaspartate(D-aspartate) O-methyltransferase